MEDVDRACFARPKLGGSQAPPGNFWKIDAQKCILGHSQSQILCMYMV